MPDTHADEFGSKIVQCGADAVSWSAMLVSWVGRTPESVPSRQDDGPVVGGVYRRHRPDGRSLDAFAVAPTISPWRLHAALLPRPPGVATFL